MQLEYTAPQHVRDAIAALGRTEDVKFSPSNNRLAVASLLKNEITVFEISLGISPHGREISITDVANISSSYIEQPHGIDFIDEDTIIVANRRGDATIFKLPSAGGGDCYNLVPLEIIRSGDVLNTPGNVSITRKSENVCEALICSNFGNKVTKHLIDLGADCSVRSEILLKKWLDLPDGVSVSEPWIAISNHNAHCVLLYENTGSLNAHSDPDGILRGACYPHGLRFTADGRFILVADAGAPYVHIYAKDGSDWRGVRSPYKSVKVLSDEDFLRGRTSIHEGGPKGIDVDRLMRILVTTCEIQTLAFFDLAEILEWISLVRRSMAHDSPDFRERANASFERHCQDQKALAIKYELDRLTQIATVAAIRNSLSWRITEPFRWARALPKRIAIQLPREK